MCVLAETESGNFLLQYAYLKCKSSRVDPGHNATEWSQLYNITDIPSNWSRHCLLDEANYCLIVTLLYFAMRYECTYIKYNILIHCATHYYTTIQRNSCCNLPMYMFREIFSVCCWFLHHFSLIQASLGLLLRGCSNVGFPATVYKLYAEKSDPIGWYLPRLWLATNVWKATITQASEKKTQQSKEEDNRILSICYYGHFKDQNKSSGTRGIFQKRRHISSLKT